MSSVLRLAFCFVSWCGPTGHVSKYKSMLRFWIERLTKSCPHRRALELSTTLACGYTRSATSDVTIESDDVVLVVVNYCTIDYLARLLRHFEEAEYSPLEEDLFLSKHELFWVTFDCIW